MTKASYTPTIGIECHVQLNTATKLFSGADNDARDKSPNTTVSPLCFGMPGALPVVNEAAISLAIRAGIALQAKIPQLSRFERKHYFYPDLPLGYQITQLAEPIIGAGRVEVPLPDGSSKVVRIHHAHLEADAGKLTHPSGADYSLVDYNRAGTPLIEIVSEADMHSPAEAKAYAQELYQLMTFAGVTDGDLYHGNMRFDINVSVSTTDELGTRTETKNLNSFRSVEKAAEYEIKRQIALLEKGHAITQETRGWDEAKQQTFSQRSKEDAHDYRYFPDADIPPIRVESSVVKSIRSKMPTLPHEYRQNFQVLQLDSTVILALMQSRSHCELVQRLIDGNHITTARRTALWLAMLSADQSADELIKNSDKPQIPDDYYIELGEMVERQEVHSSAAKQIFIQMRSTHESPRHIAKQKNLLQLSDTSEIEAIVTAILDDPSNQKSIEDIRSGNERAIGFLVGQVMKQSQGKANPQIATTLLKERIRKESS